MGKSGSSSKVYSGSFAVFIGIGPADILEKIENGDTQIWPSVKKQPKVWTAGSDAPIFRGDAMDADGKTTLTTSIGKIHFYWGTANQNQNPLLAGLRIDQGAGTITAPIPNFKRMIYAVCENVNFGSQSTPPTLNFTIRKFSSALTLPVSVSRVNLTFAGQGYVNEPTVVFTGGGGTGAAATASIKDGAIRAIKMISQGTGYTSAPSVAFTGGLLDQTGATNAAGTAVLLGGAVQSVTITNHGSLYAVGPTVTFSGGGGTGASGIALIFNGKVTGIDITDQGSGYTSPPTVSFSGGRPMAGTATAYTFHELNGDAMIPEVIYEVLTDGLFGGAIDPANIVTQDFIDACAKVVSEDLGCSPQFTETMTIRELIGKLTPYIDAFCRREAGKIGFEMIRPVDLSGTIQINEDDMTDELIPENQGFKETWDITRVTFKDIENKYQNDSEPFFNPAVSTAVGYSVNKEFNYPFITRRDVAKKVAKRLGIKGGRPPFFFKTRLLPFHSARQIGEVVRLSYARYGYVDVAARITNKEIGEATSPDVNITLLVEQTRSDVNDYVPPQDFFTTPGLIDADGSDQWGFTPTQPRVMILPPDLLDNKSDGWITLYNRTRDSDLKANVYFTYNPAFLAYTKVTSQKGFAVQGYVQNWHRAANSGNWILRVRFVNALDYEGFVSLITESTDLYFVMARRDVKLAGTPSDVHQVAGFWAAVIEGGYFEQITADTFDVEVQAGQFGGTDMALETIASPASGPAEICYFGTQDIFAIYKNNSKYFQRIGGNGSFDTDYKRRVKVALKNHKAIEDLDECLEANYDRDDTTMSPDGTYSPDYSVRAPTTYELFDQLEGDYFASAAAYNFTQIKDIDQALLRFYDGLDTTIDKIAFASINQTLGFYFQQQNGVYNLNP